MSEYSNLDAGYFIWVSSFLCTGVKEAARKLSECESVSIGGLSFFSSFLVTWRRGVSIIVLSPYGKDSIFSVLADVSCVIGMS